MRRPIGRAFRFGLQFLSSCCKIRESINSHQRREQQTSAEKWAKSHRHLGAGLPALRGPRPCINPTDKPWRYFRGRHGLVWRCCGGIDIAKVSAAPLSLRIQVACITLCSAAVYITSISAGDVVEDKPYGVVIRGAPTKSAQVESTTTPFVPTKTSKNVFLTQSLGKAKEAVNSNTHPLENRE
eukprot:GHVN01078154.1.p1 GENE.GHVN01078154.1~~GHVN01078154.1.p1  ORF type:complete len:183 (+),score=6.23 GHVN01078154.1:33-581(+)